MIYVYERSAVAECDKQLLKYFQQKIPGSEMTASEIYQNCEVAVMFGSWKKIRALIQGLASQLISEVGVQRKM